MSDNTPTSPGTPELVTASQLIEIMPHCPSAMKVIYAMALSEAMLEREIWTVTRAAAFLGQLALESGELKWFVEQGDGLQYEGRADLGNTTAGDGPRYKGRGPIQLTGRKNYAAAGEALGIDLEGSPEKASDPSVCFRVSAWFWASRGLNDKADALDFEGVTRAINGGLTNLDRRLVYTNRALGVLGRGARLG